MGTSEIITGLTLPKHFTFDANLKGASFDLSTPYSTQHQPLLIEI